MGQARPGRAGGSLARCAGLLLALWAPAALAQVSVAVSDASVVEGNTGTRSMVFTVTRSGDPTAVRFRYTTEPGGSATAATDYTAVSGSVALAAGQATATFSVPVRGDTVVEPQETVLVSISNDPVNAQALVVLDGSGTGTIIDDDTAPTASISVSPASVVENSGPNLVYRVALSQPYGTALTVNFSVGGTATAGTDYAAIGASVTIPAGSSGANVTVNPTNDSTLEPHETVVITLAAGSGYAVGSPASATGTILNDDSPVVNVAVAPASMAEDAGTPLVYTFTLSQPKATAVSLVYTLTGTATSGTDYAAPASPLVIPAGSTSGTITVVPTADTTIEASETVIVTLQNGSGYTRGTAVATGTILNDDTSTATIAVAPGAVLENGTPNLVYTVTLSQAAAVATSVNFTVSGTATSGTDYAAVVSPLVIPAGATSRTITVNPAADTVIEADETVIVSLAAGSSYVVGTPAIATGTITNDDLPTLVINDVSVIEGDSGTINAGFTVTLSQAVGQDVSVNYATANGTASGTTDYTPTSGTLTIPAGAVTGTINVPVRGDTQAEANETFVVNLASPVNARITDTQGRGTITDDDTRTATLSLAPAAVQEDGATGLAYTVTLSRPALAATTVRFTVAGTATSGTDYTAVGTSVVIPVGATTRTVTVVPIADTTVEMDETVVLTLVAGTGYVVGTPASATGTIGNDDVSTATIAVAPASVAEDGGTGLVFTVTLSQPASAPTTVDFSVGGTATSGSDYAAAGTSVVIPAGSATGTITVLPTADATVEVDDTVQLALAAGTGYVVGSPSSATGTISNDDVPTATVAVSPASVDDDSGAGLVFTVTLSQPANAPTTVDFSVGGTATAGSDYSVAGTSVVVPAGGIAGTVTVMPIADSTVELDESVVLILANGTGYAVGSPSSAAGTIGNDDVSIATVAVSPASVDEDSGASLVFTVTLSQPAAMATTVDFTLGGTATAGSDYGSIGTSVIVAAGATSGMLTVVPLADTAVEATESVVLTLASGTGYVLGLPSSATGTIGNDDVPTATVAVSPASADEDSGVGLVFTVMLSQPAAVATMVDFDVGGTATAGSDYVAVGASVVVAAGASSGTVTVAPLADSIAEMDETVVLTLAAGTGYSVGSPGVATGTIDNDDTITLDLAALPAATVASAYAQVVSAVGGTGPYRYALTAGALPAGLSLAGDGTLAGTPTAGGAFLLTVTATDSLGLSGSASHTLMVNPPVIVLGPATLAQGTAGVGYSQAMAASDGTAPYRYTVTAGALPAGMTLTTDGLLAGTPLADGTFNVSITATDSSTGSGPYTASQAYALVISATAIDAVDDAGAVANGARGGVAIADVLANDRVGGGPATLVEVSLTQISSSNSGVTLDTGSGAVNVAAATATGTFTVVYRICEARYAANCSDATATVGIGAAVIDAAEDAGSALAGTASIAVASVLANDTLDAAPATLAGVSLALVSTSDPAVTLDAGSGAVLVAATATAGTQVLAYRLCEILNPDNCDAATVTITVNAAPLAQSRELEIAADAPASVDLAEGASGGPFTAATLVALVPANAGRATVQAVGSGAAARFILEFVPAAGFGGSARVQFTLANAFAVSPVATLVFQVQPRPDPALDPEVRGIIDAQVQSTRRFADVQGDNVRGRLESLHGSGSRQGRLDNRVGFAMSRECVQQTRPGDREDKPLCERSDADPAIASGSEQAVGEAAARPYGAWIGGQVRSGSFDGSGGSGAGFETDGISVGVDIDLAPAFTLGAGLGYGRDDNEIGEQGSALEGRATSYLGYASYHPGRFFIDGLAGYQQLTFDLRRALDGGGMVAGTRQGRQWFGSLVLGADLPSGNGQLTPYARFDVASATLNAYGESGHATRALRFEAMDVDARTGNAGFRYDYRLAMSWGTLTPQFRTEYQYDFTDPQVAAMRYADLPEGLAYRMEGTRLDRRRLVFGAGVTLDWSSGLGMRLEYRTGSGSEDGRDQDVSVNLQKQF